MCLFLQERVSPHCRPGRARTLRAYTYFDLLFSCAFTQPKTAWRSKKTVNLLEIMMCLKTLVERVYVCLFTFGNIYSDETC